MRDIRGSLRWVKGAHMATGRPKGPWEMLQRRGRAATVSIST